MGRMNRKSEEKKEEQISEVMASIENRVRHAYNQGYEQGLKDSKQEPCEQIKWERDTAIKQLNELGYGLGEKIEPCKDCISRKALLDAIYQKEYGTDYYDGNMLNIPYIDLIKQMPSVKPCEDAISRQAVLNILKIVYKEYCRTDNEKALMEEIARLTHGEPSVTTNPKTGHWKQYGNSWEDKFKCSECGKEQPKILCGEQIIGYWSDYCPNCGCRMKGEGEE